MARRDDEPGQPQEEMDDAEGSETEDESEGAKGRIAIKNKGKSRRKASEKPEGSDQKRQAFSKRKRGLILKSYQLYKLTDARVFVFIVNDKGSSWAYASPGFARTLSNQHLSQMREYAQLTGNQRLSTEIMPHPHTDVDDRRIDDRPNIIRANLGPGEGPGGGGGGGMAATAGGASGNGAATGPGGAAAPTVSGGGGSGGSGSGGGRNPLPVSSSQQLSDMPPPPPGVTAARRAAAVAAAAAAAAAVQGAGGGGGMSQLSPGPSPVPGGDPGVVEIREGLAGRGQLGRCGPGNNNNNNAIKLKYTMGHQSSHPHSHHHHRMDPHMEQIECPLDENDMMMCDAGPPGTTGGRGGGGFLAMVPDSIITPSGHKLAAAVGIALPADAGGDESDLRDPRGGLPPPPGGPRGGGGGGFGGVAMDRMGLAAAALAGLQPALKQARHRDSVVHDSGSSPPGPLPSHPPPPSLARGRRLDQAPPLPPPPPGQGPHHHHQSQHQQRRGQGSLGSGPDSSGLPPLVEVAGQQRAQQLQLGYSQQQHSHSQGRPRLRRPAVPGGSGAGRRRGAPRG